ncbi:hypothetical protein BGX31_005715 [Mortierella sp. GBA43]|nr:hypothetical protein BGX31_005715 [Mortierella sp. GBA43]
MAHMQWAMEVLGQGFALPLEELSIAQNITQVYSQWLFDTSKRPQAFREAEGTPNEQKLYQTIFHHYSLLFEVRPAFPPSPGVNHLNNQHHRHSTTPVSNSSSSSSTHATPTPVAPVGVQIQRHIEQCKKVITVLTMAGRQLGSSFSEETWEVLLKVVLGITDSLLRDNIFRPPAMLTGHIKMSEELCEHLLRVLFELWLRSNTRRVELWDILRKCFNHWTHRLPVLSQWAATSLGLCLRVVRLLYGPNQGSEIVNLSVAGYNVALDLPADFTLYAWHRVIYLLDSPAKLSPTNCLAAVSGIGKMVETFLSVGSSNNQSAAPGSPPLPSTPTDIYSPSSLSPSNQPTSPNAFKTSAAASGSNSAPGKPTSPNGNTIMHMFGAWLFEVTALPTDPAPSNSHWQSGYPPYLTEGYSDAQACAFGVLCRIFSKPQPSSRPFMRIYTERFYEALSIGLRCEASLPTILMHSAELFTSELEGVRMMVPDFVIGIRMAMSGQIHLTTGAMSSEGYKRVLEDLHLAALKVAGCIMCLPNHFEKVELKEGWNQGLSRPASIALDGKGGREDKEILAQLIRVLYTTEAPVDGGIMASKRFTSLKYYILEMLLSCLETETSSFNLRYLLHLIEVYVYEDAAFCPGLVGVVVKTIQEKIMTIQVPVDVALSAFDVLIGCAGLYEHVRRDSKSCARELVIALCKYIDALLANHALLTNTHQLIVRAYECMLQWILAGQWIVGDQDCHLDVIRSIGSGLHIAERVEEQEANLAAPKPQPEKRRWGGSTSTVGTPLGKPSGGKLFQNNKYPGPIKILNHESKKDKENRKNRSANSSISGPVRATRQELLSIQHAAEIAMMRFSNQLGNFPIWADDIGPSRVSTLWNDLALNRATLDRLKELNGFEPVLGHHAVYSAQPSPALNLTGPVRYFVLDRRTIIGCCEAPNLPDTDKDFKKGLADERGPFAIVTIRDSNGKNSWKLRMNYQQNKSKVNGVRRDSSSSTITVSKDALVAKFKAGSRDSEPSPIPSPKVLTVEAADESSIGLGHYVKPQTKSESASNTSYTESGSPDTESEGDQKTAFEPGESENERSSQFDEQMTSSNAFRILLSQMGYLSLENRSRVLPLRLSDRLLAELQFLDDLRERDCIGISVYFAQSGGVSFEELIYGPLSGLSKDFTRFLDCLGWPIQIETHSGYLGQLRKEICETTPYFADRNCEVIYHVPYLMQSSSPDAQHLQDQQLMNQFRTVTLHNQVAIVWVQDRDRMTNLLSLIDAMVYILIHPLGGDSAGGLFWIRIMVQSAHATAGSVRLAANPLMIGPLTDGMLVSRHALGSLVRNTAISADKACRQITESFMEPSVSRAKYIQDVLQMHHSDESETISDFYRSMFAM